MVEPSQQSSTPSYDNMPNTIEYLKYHISNQESEMKLDLIMRELKARYFDSHDFPPTTDIEIGGTNETFCQLKTYIESVSNAKGSPVICNSGSRIRHNKVLMQK